MASKDLKYPMEQCREFALWAHASTCFGNCVDACKLLLEQKVTPSHPLYKPLTVCAVIEYGKPFKGSRGIGRISDLSIIPDEKLHADVIQVRDKIVAHIDTQGMPSSSPHLHCVRLEVKDRDVYYIVEEPKLHPEMVPKLLSQGEKLRETADYHAKKHVRKLCQVIKHAGTGQGEYLIELEGPNGIRILTEAEKATLYWD